MFLQRSFNSYEDLRMSDG